MMDHSTNSLSRSDSTKMSASTHDDPPMPKWPFDIKTTEFYLTMTPENQAVIQHLIDGHWIFHPTGSRWICPSYANQDSDWDVIILNQHGMEGATLPKGIKVREELEVDEFSPEEAVPKKQYGTMARSYYCNESLNLIEMTGPKFYQWLTATRICMTHPKANTRAGRIAIFQACERADLSFLLSHRFD